MENDERITAFFWIIPLAITYSEKYGLVRIGASEIET